MNAKDKRTGVGRATQGDQSSMAKTISPTALTLAIPVIVMCVALASARAQAPDSRRMAPGRFLSVMVSSNDDVTVVDPLGRTVRAGSGVPDSLWRSEFEANCSVLPEGVSVLVTDPSSGRWHVYAAVESAGATAQLTVGYWQVGVVRSEVKQVPSRAYAHWALTLRPPGARAPGLLRVSEHGTARKIH